MPEAYGKFPKATFLETLVMEYQPFLEWAISKLDGNHPPNDFKEWLAANPNILDDFADVMVYTLPLPRYKHYESTNFQHIQNRITDITNQVTIDLGFYPTHASMGLLKFMKYT